MPSPRRPRPAGPASEYGKRSSSRSVPQADESLLVTESDLPDPGGEVTSRAVAQGRTVRGSLWDDRAVDECRGLFALAGVALGEPASRQRSSCGGQRLPRVFDCGDLAGVLLARLLANGPGRRWTSADVG